MLPIVSYPSLVEKYAGAFEGSFSAAGYEQFKRYLSGLLVSENKTVEELNRGCWYRNGTKAP